MTVLSRTTLPYCGPYIGFYELDTPLEVVGLVFRQVDRSRLFMEWPMDVYEGICVLVRSWPAPFDQYGDCQFVGSPAPAPESEEDEDVEGLIGSDGELSVIHVPPRPDGSLSELALGFKRWRDALCDVDPSEACARLHHVYPDPVPCGSRIKTDLIETVAWLADRVRQVIDRNGTIAISGV